MGTGGNPKGALMAMGVPIGLASGWGVGADFCRQETTREETPKRPRNKTLGDGRTGYGLRLQISKLLRGLRDCRTGLDMRVGRTNPARQGHEEHAQFTKRRIPVPAHYSKLGLLTAPMRKLGSIANHQSPFTNALFPLTLAGPKCRLALHKVGRRRGRQSLRRLACRKGELSDTRGGL